MRPTGSRQARRVAMLNNWLLFPLVILASIVLLIHDPVTCRSSWARSRIFALWMVNLAVLLALFARYYRIFGVPILGTLIALLIAFEVFGLTDNHQFRHQAVPTVSRARASRPPFRTWLGSRAGPRRLSQRRQALSRLHRRCRRRRALRRLPDRQVPRRACRTSAATSPSTCSPIELGLGRQPRRGCLRGPDPRYANNEPTQAVPASLPEAGQLREARRHHPVARSAGAGDLGRRCSRTSCSASCPIRFPELDRAARSNSPSRTPGSHGGGPRKQLPPAARSSSCAEPTRRPARRARRRRWPST